MKAISIRDLRDHADEVVDRVTRGETLRITRGGAPVAELRPLGGSSLSADVLLRRWRHLPKVDPARLRADLDDILDPTL